MILTKNGNLMKFASGAAVNAHIIDPYNPLGLPPFTIRVKCPVTPTEGTVVSVDPVNKIWDITYELTAEGGLPVEYNVRRYMTEFLGANTSNVTYLSGMLNGAKNITSVPLFDTRACTNMTSLFSHCTSLTTVPLFDTSNVTDMRHMFNGCSSLTTVPLFNTSNVTLMNSMFDGCTSLTTVPLFNTSNVTLMVAMLRNCSSLTTVPLFNTSSCTNMGAMLSNCRNVESGALALYQQASTQTTPPSNHDYTFMNCGIDTITGAAELAQIPSDWK